MAFHILETELKLKELLSQKGKTVLFIHTRKSVEKIAQFKEIFDKKNCIIIPTSIEVLFYLDKMNLPYRIPEDYYAPEEIIKYTKGLEIKIIDWVGKIDYELEIAYPEIKQPGLKIALFNLFPFVRAYSPLADAYFKITKIIQKENPDRICLVTDQEVGQRADIGWGGWLMWKCKENIFLKILSFYQTNLPIHSFIYDTSDPSPKSVLSNINWKNKIRMFVKKRPRLYYFLKILKKDKRSVISLFFNHFSKSVPLLLLNEGYDWNLCHKELYKKGYYIWGAINDNLEDWFQGHSKIFESSRDILYNLENNIAFREAFNESNIDFYPILKDKISLFLEAIVPASFEAYKRTMKLIQKNKIRGVLFSINPTATSKSIACAAQKSGIPVIGWQHGDMNYELIHSMVSNDLLLSDLFLGWGKEGNKNRTNSFIGPNAEYKQRVVGSATLDKLMVSPVGNRAKVLNKANIKNAKGLVVVYATGMYFLSNIYNFCHTPPSDNHLYNTQKNIIERLALLKGIKIIKFHPNLFYALLALDDYCQSFKKQNVWTVRNETTSPSLFSIADIIIIDQPSTTLLQAIACKKPIFCLTCHLKLDDKAEELLKKRVVLSNDPKELMREVKFFIESGKYKADINNNEFLENFGTSLNGKAAERAAVAVDELIKDFHLNKHV